MSGPQFGHLQTYSRKPNPGGQSVAQILGEAARDPDFSKHIDKPAVPDLIYGMTLAALSKAHDDMCNGASVLVQLKNGKTATRAVRKDRHTLCTFVASYPVPRHKIEEDKTGQEKVLFEEWKKLNIEYLQRKYGDQLATVIEHKDEAFGHIHAFILPTSHDDIDARSLNPAFEVKRRVMAEFQLAQEQGHKAAGTTPKQPDKEKGERGEAWDALVAGNRAYKTAARAMADEYYAEVGAPAGLTREGPKRRRLSRGEWLRETTDARASSRLALQAQKNKAQEEAEKQAQAVLKAARDKAEQEANAIIHKAHVFTHEVYGKAQMDLNLTHEEAETILETAHNKGREIIQEAEAIKNQSKALVKDAQDELARRVAKFDGYGKHITDKLVEWFGQEKSNSFIEAVVSLWPTSSHNPERKVEAPKSLPSSSYSR